MWLGPQTEISFSCCDERAWWALTGRGPINLLLHPGPVEALSFMYKHLPGP